MNRRPKLSIVATKTNHKKQALDFETSQPTGTNPAGKNSDPGPDAPSLKSVPPEQLKARNSPDNDQQSSRWSNRKLLAKAMITAVTVALSIYLLKRRFF